MSDNVTSIEEARFQRNKRLLQERIDAAGQQAAAAFLTHLEAVARNAPREVVNRRWQAVEERAAAYQELLQTGDVALRSGLDTTLREQVDGEFEADWLEALREPCLHLLGDQALEAPEDDEARLRLACQLAYRRGYAVGMINTSILTNPERDE
ncbi:MAG: hypothetical protein U0232_21015 [Thermomicrobiales bacterium]